MTAQLELSLLPANPQALSLVGMVREALLVHEWLTPYEIQQWVQRRYGQWHSDAATTARLRDLRKAAYGAHEIIKRKREGTRSFEYRLEA